MFMYYLCCCCYLWCLIAHLTDHYCKAIIFVDESMTKVIDTLDDMIFCT